MITLLLTAGLERAIQCYLQLDKQTLEKLKALTDKVVHIHINDWNITFYIFPNAQGVRLQNHYDGIPNVSLISTLNAFAKMGLSKKGQLILPDDMKISGDTMLAQKISQIALNSHIDWEEILSIVTGDGIAHQIANLAKRFNKFKQQAQHKLEENISEYLQEEARYMPPVTEVEDFFDDIHLLKNDIDRLAVKFHYLQQKTNTIL